MDCGVEVTLNDLLSCIGLGNKLEAGTPSTVGLNVDENASRDAILKSATKTLTYGICLPSSSSPSKGNTVKKELKFVGCNPQTCRMTSGICIDCTHCHIHCVCGNNDKAKLGNLSARSKQALLSMQSTPQQQQLRKSPSLMTESSDGSAFLGASDKPSPSKHRATSQTSGPRYDMGGDEVCVKLTSRMLKEHTNRSKRSYRSNSETSSHNSYMSYNSSKTGSSSRRRYNFGDEDENEIYQQPKTRHTRGHRRTLSGVSTSSSRKSNTSFSLLSLKKKNSSTSTKPSDDPIIGKTFSFDSNNSHSSAGNLSAYGDDRTRGSATTARRANSQKGGGSLSSSSRSYLDGSDVEAAEPKKSWFRRRLESKE